MSTKSCPSWSTVGPNYKWPRESVIDDVDYVTHGRFSNLPPSSSKLVRIFMSSTFTDTYTERNLLMQNVYPKLQKLCKEKYDLDFQVVDMRWGVRNEATVDHSASELCMSEIDACKQYSVGPMFVALLSHRYGGRHVPSRLSFEEFKNVLEEIRSWTTHKEDVAVVEKWYRLDENALPHEYILQPIIDPKKIENLLQLSQETGTMDEPLLKPEDPVTSKEIYRQLVEEGKNIWQEEEPVLKRILRTAATKCLEKGIFKEDQTRKYFQSITEEEITKGLIEEMDNKNRCLVFRRTINNINIKHEKAWRFIDKADDDSLDSEAQDLLIRLRDSTIPTYLPQENIRDFTVDWSDDEGINENDHKDYLMEFCSTFEKAILDLIERGVKTASVSSVSKVYSEVLEHSHQCLQKVERFHGREAELQRVKEYITSASDQPLIVHGDSGCGKTSLLAKAAIEIPEWIGDNKDVCTVLRFLGTTPDSSTIYKLLLNISNQIIFLTGQRHIYPDLPQEFSDLKDTFKDILASIPTNKRIILIIDSLDQLSNSNAAHKLLWFPNRLPPHVKVIASTLPEEHRILKKLKSVEMELDKGHFVPVETLETETSHQILRLWLAKKNRCLSQTQEVIIGKLLKNDVRPLYLKLVFDEISNWKSYEEPSFDCPTIATCLQRFYQKLEIKHGEKLVQKALGYLSASKNGLTKIEVEDILSLDEEVLNDVFEFHVPPIRRLPSILWARIRRDLTEYIVDRDADGAKVMAWYHRQFIQEAQKRYLPGTVAFHKTSVGLESNLPLYKALADYFAGTWGRNKKKPFTYTEYQRKKLKLDSPESAAERYVPDQPTIYRSEEGSIDIENLRYNLRKISELPHACTNIASHEDNTAFVAQHIALNPEFLAAWINSSPWEEIAEYMNEASRDSQYATDSKELTHKFIKSTDNRHNLEKAAGNESSGSEEELNWDDMRTGTPGLVLQISTVQQCLLLSYISVLNNPTYLGVDVTGRLLPYNGLLDGIVKWIKHTDEEGRHLCALVPPHLQLESPGSELMFVINNHLGPVRDAAWSDNNDNICLSVSKKFVVVSLEAGQIIVDTKPRSMPEGDSFNKIITVTNILDTAVYVTSLLNNPYIYAFSEEGEVLSSINVATITGKTFEITDINWFKTEHSKACVVVNGKAQNTVFFLQDILKESVTSIEVGGKDSGKVLAVYVGKKSTKGKVLLLKDTNTWELYDEIGTLLDKKQFPWPQISAISHDQSNGDDITNIPVGFENGQICIVNWSMQDLDLNDFLPKYLLRKRIVESNMAPYGVSHYVFHHQFASHGECIPIALSCSNTHLCVFGDLNKLLNLLSTSDSSEDDKKKPDKEPTLKLLCRIRKKFDMAVFTPKLRFILATHGGAIDCFKIDIEKIDTVGFKAHYFATIDAHGQEINKILVTEEDILFMTASKDSSLKFYMLVKAGATRKYIPNFDHTEHDVKEIFPGMATAMTCSKPSRFIHYWDIISGKIKGLFQHPLNHRFLKCATSDNIDQLVAIDENGKCYRWRLLNKEKSTVGQPRLRRRTTSKLKPLSAAQNQVVIEAPDPDFQMDTGIKMDKTSDYQNVHMILIDTEVAVMAFKHNQKVYIAQINEGGKTEELNDFKGPVRYALKMKDRALLISELECAIVTTEGSRTNVFTLQELLGATFANVSDVSYASAEDMVLFVSSNKLILWKQTTRETGKPSIELEGMNPTSAKNILTSETSICVVMDKEAKQFCRVNLTTGRMMEICEIKKKNQPVQHAKVTPDGQYLLYVTGDKDLYLVRLSDGKLLAWYTMYDPVQSLSASADSWFVLVGTSDKRLFVLVIADPLESSHDRRIAHVRKLNPPLTQDQMVTLMGDVNSFDLHSDESYYDSSDDDYLIEKASKRMQQRANNALGKKMKVLYSSDSSGEEDDDDMMKHRPKNRTGGSRLHNENSVIGAPTISAYDGDMCTTAPCTLQ